MVNMDIPKSRDYQRQETTLKVWVEVQLNLIKYHVDVFILQQRQSSDNFILNSVNRIDIDKMIDEVTDDVCNLSFPRAETPERDNVIILIIAILVYMGSVI